jgi:tetraacyldisaccharide 4'-kinase
MSLLASLYGFGVRARNSLYDRGVLPARRLQGPVVSIGNLSVGGAGKTPFVMVLGELLKRRGVDFDVLSRGYGRTSRSVAVVDPAGTARDFGDEPLLIARRLAVPVVVAESRYAAGLAAEQRFGPRLHLLDDGFQHRALARDLDIVLVTQSDARDRLLPEGRLREPLSSLRRCHVVVLTGEAWPTDFPIQGKRVWRLRRGIEIEQASARPVVFCAIARPNDFVAQLRSRGVCPVAEAFFRDHHAYTEKDIAELRALKLQSEADGFITTEKDGINLGEFRSRLEPLSVVRVQMALVDADAAIDFLLDAVGNRPALPVSPAEK